MTVKKKRKLREKRNNKENLPKSTALSQVL